MGTIAGKIALVTGAGGGIGQGIALELARQGAHVAIHYAHQADGANEAMQEIQRLGLGNKVLTVQGDLSQVSECRRVVDTVTQAWDGIDILVNNAGVTSARDFFTVNEELYNQVFDLNMRGYFFCAQQAARSMLTRGGGSIVNISSAHGFAGFPRHSAYAATKGAINAFTRQLAVDMASHHIRVNAVAPGIIEVPRYFAIADYTTTLGDTMVPWGRVGHPADVASAVAFLASDCVFRHRACASRLSLPANDAVGAGATALAPHTIAWYRKDAPHH